MLSIIEPEKKISKKIADGRGKCCVQPHRALSVWKVCHAFRLQLVQHTGGECRRDIFCICSDRYLVEPSLALPILRGIPVTLQQFLVGVLSASLFFFFRKKCLMSIYNLSVMTDPPSMFPYGALFLYLRRGVH